MGKLTFSLLIILFSLSVSAGELCRASKSTLQSRYQFLEKLNDTHNRDLRMIERTARDTRQTLNAMENAHLASDIAQTASAVAGLVAGGAAIGTLYFSGGSISFLGMSISSGTIGAHLYTGYNIGSNLLTLGQVGYNVLREGESYEDVLERQMDDLRQTGLFSEDAIKFVTEPIWNGWSTSLQSPPIQEAFKKLDEFYEAKIEEIGDNGGLWSYIGEFWHERGLKRAGLDVAVTAEAVKLQKLRVEYFEVLKRAVVAHYQYCY